MVAFEGGYIGQKKEQARAARACSLEDSETILELLGNDYKWAVLDCKLDADTARRAFRRHPIEYVLCETALYRKQLWKRLGEVHQIAR